MVTTLQIELLSNLTQADIINNDEIFLETVSKTR